MGIKFVVWFIAYTYMKNKMYEISVSFITQSVHKYIEQEL